MSDFEKGVAMVAVALSIGVHLLGFFAFALLVASGLMHRAVARVTAPEDYVFVRPEMLLVEEPLPSDRRFLRSPEQTVPMPPPETRDISDRDSRAASEGEVADPVREDRIALDGEVEHGLEVVNRNFADGAEEVAAADTPRPPAPVAAATVRQPLDEALHNVRPGEGVLESLADLGVIPLPDPSESEGGAENNEAGETAELPPTPDQSVKSLEQTVDTGFVHEARRRKFRGMISNQGVASFDARATPTGKYLARVTREIERRWRAQVDLHRDFVTFATLRVTFFIDKSGTVHELKISRDEANAVIKDFTLSAILEADLPPIPPDLQDILEGEQIEMSYDIVIY